MTSYTLQGFHARCEHCGAIKSRRETPLTRKQVALYDYLYDYIEQHRHAPSFAEIADTFDYASLATVHEHLTNLEAKGWIKRRYNESRSIECLVARSEQTVIANLTSHDTAEEP